MSIPEYVPIVVHRQERPVHGLVGALGVERSRSIVQSVVLEIMKHEEQQMVESKKREKQAYLENLFLRDPAIFLERYGKYLHRELVDAISSFKDDYEINFHVKALSERLDIIETRNPLDKTLNANTSQQHANNNFNSDAMTDVNDGNANPNPALKVRNRRYEILKRKEAIGYFSESAIASRALDVYQDFMGDYAEDFTPIPLNAFKEVDELLKEVKEFVSESLPDNQIASEDTTTQTLSTLTLNDLSTEQNSSQATQNQQNESPWYRRGPDTRIDAMRDIDDENLSEHDTDSEGERQPNPGNQVSFGVITNEKYVPMDSNKLMEREHRFELLQKEMKERFLSGGDESVNFDEIDFNCRLDNLKQMERDEEEGYFGI